MSGINIMTESLSSIKSSSKKILKIDRLGKYKYAFDLFHNRL